MGPMGLFSRGPKPRYFPRNASIGPRAVSVGFVDVDEQALETISGRRNGEAVEFHTKGDLVATPDGVALVIKNQAVGWLRDKDAEKFLPVISQAAEANWVLRGDALIIAREVGMGGAETRLMFWMAKPADIAAVLSR